MLLFCFDKGGRWELESVAERTSYRFVILALACALAFMGNFLQYQVSGLAVGVMSVLEIDTAGFQLLFLTPMLASVFFSMPFGVLGDKIGPKRVVGIAFVFTLGGGFLRLLDLGNFALQLVSVFMMGIGMAALVANNAKTLGLWFGEKTDFAMGFFYAFSCLGISASQASAGLMGSIFESYLAADIVLAVILMLWFIFGKNVSSASQIPKDAVHAPTFMRAIKSRDVWLIAICAGLSLAATTGYAGILPQALELDRGFDTTSAGQMASLLTLASMLGCIAAPVLCARFRRVNSYLIVMSIVGTIVMFTTWLVPDNGLILLAMLLLNGLVTCMLGPVLQALPVVLPKIGTRFAGSAGGVIAEVSLLLSFMLPIVVSLIAGQDYGLNFAILSLCFALTLVPIVLMPRFSWDLQDNVG